MGIGKKGAKKLHHDIGENWRQQNTKMCESVLEKSMVPQMDWVKTKEHLRVVLELD